ncbi:putative anaphase-promoting complex subunit, partial [Planoprotostelium fungivorum]
MRGLTVLNPFRPPKPVNKSSSETDDVTLRTPTHWHHLFSRDGEHDFDHGFYVRENTLFWTTGERLTRQFTFPYNADEAHMATFPHTNEKASHLCVLHRDELLLSIYDTSSGQDFYSSTPTRVSSLWPTPFGLLVQRDVNNHRSLFSHSDMDQSFSRAQGMEVSMRDQCAPVIFSMGHPLEELCPVSYHNSFIDLDNPSQAFITEEQFHIVWSSIHLPIVVLFDKNIKKHSIWKIHPAPKRHVAPQKVIVKVHPFSSSQLKSVPKSVVDEGEDLEQMPSALPRDLCSPMVTSQIFLEMLYEEPHSLSGSSGHIFTVSDEFDSTFICIHSGDKIHAYDVAKLCERTAEERVVDYILPNVACAVPLCSTRRPNVHGHILNDLLLLDKSGNLNLYVGTHCIATTTFRERGEVVEIRDAVYNRFNAVCMTPEGKMEVVRLQLDLLPVYAPVSDGMRALASSLPFPLVAKLFLAWCQDERGDLEGWSSFCDLFLEAEPIKSEEMGRMRLMLVVDETAWEKMQRLQKTNGIEMNVPKRNGTEISLSDQERVISLCSIHMVYEDYKLDTLCKHDLLPLARFLVRLSVRCGCPLYTDYYLRDFPEFSSLVGTVESKYSIHPPSIYNWLRNTLESNFHDFPMLSHSRVFPCESILCGRPDVRYQRTVQIRTWLTCSTALLPGPITGTSNSPRDSVVLSMVSEHFTLSNVEQLPFGVSLPLLEVFRACRQECPPPSAKWPAEGYVLIDRLDVLPRSTKSHRDFDEESLIGEREEKQKDGTDFHLPSCDLRFGRDLRLKEVSRILTSSRVIVFHDPLPSGMADHDIMTFQQEKILQIAKVQPPTSISDVIQRTMSLCVGRGMFTMATSPLPLPTDTIVIPPMIYNARQAGAKLVVSPDQNAVPAEMSAWADFHNGVASGLRLGDGSERVSSTWIAYNRPELNKDTPADTVQCSHAGVLLALGLRGHLSSLARTKQFLYLTASHTLTNVGLLLGMSANFRGTMDPNTSKLMSVHIPALQPPLSTDLDVTSIVLEASLVGIGLLYMGSCHRRVTEVLLGEISRKPRDVPENRESLSLSAGLALGFVLLGHGSKTSGLSDLHVEDRLTKLILGGEETNKTAP